MPEVLKASFEIYRPVSFSEQVLSAMRSALAPLRRELPTKLSRTVKLSRPGDFDVRAVSARQLRAYFREIQVDPEPAMVADVLDFVEEGMPAGTETAINIASYPLALFSARRHNGIAVDFYAGAEDKCLSSARRAAQSLINVYFDVPPDDFTVWDENYCPAAVTLGRVISGKDREKMAERVCGLLDKANAIPESIYCHPTKYEDVMLPTIVP